MAEDKKIKKGRIKNKHAIEADWLLLNDFIPLEGEAIVYDPDENHTKPRVKYGDGVTNLHQLPFCGESVYVGSGEMPNGYNIQIIPDGDVEQDLLQKIDDTLIQAKEYTDKELAEFDFIKIVDVLPLAGGLPNRIYLIPKTETQTQDLFDEYVWINKGTEEEPNWDWEWLTTK